MENYEVIRSIGKGSFGKVYLVRHRRQITSYCLKAVKLENIPSKEREACRTEVELLQGLMHPNIVGFKESFLAKGGKLLCMVMTYCDGGDLCERLKQNRDKGRPIKETQILHWFVQLALGLQFMHAKNVLHRDLKTQNIFLLGNGRLVLGDLGISKQLDHTMDFAKTPIGTPYYMSPELFNNRPYNHKSDVWSLGCVLYEMATFKHAFDARSMNGLMNKILKGQYPPIPGCYSKQLNGLLKSLLAGDPDSRPSLPQIIRSTYIKGHAYHFLRDIIHRPENRVGAGTMVVKNAAIGVANVMPSKRVQGNMTTGSSLLLQQAQSLTKQLESLGLQDLVKRALKSDSENQQKSVNSVDINQNPSRKCSRRSINRHRDALVREKERKRAVENAIARLQKEREIRIKERREREKRIKERRAREEHREKVRQQKAEEEHNKRMQRKKLEQERRERVRRQQKLDEEKRLKKIAERRAAHVRARAYRNHKLQNTPPKPSQRQPNCDAIQRQSRNVYIDSSRADHDEWPVGDDDYIQRFKIKGDNIKTKIEGAHQHKIKDVKAVLDNSENDIGFRELDNCSPPPPPPPPTQSSDKKSSFVTPPKIKPSQNSLSAKERILALKEERRRQEELVHIRALQAARNERIGELRKAAEMQRNQFKPSPDNGSFLEMEDRSIHKKCAPTYEAEIAGDYHSFEYAEPPNVDRTSKYHAAQPVSWFEKIENDQEHIVPISTPANVEEIERSDEDSDSSISDSEASLADEYCENSNDCDEDLEEKERELHLELQEATIRCSTLKKTLNKYRANKDKCVSYSDGSSDDEDDEEAEGETKQESCSSESGSASEGSRCDSDSETVSDSDSDSCSESDTSEGRSNRGKCWGLAFRIKKLEEECINALGKERFEKVYRLLKYRLEAKLQETGHNDDDKDKLVDMKLKNILEIDGKFSFCRKVDNLIFMKETRG